MAEGGLRQRPVAFANSGSGGAQRADEDEEDAEYRLAKEKRDAAFGRAALIIVIVLPIAMFALTRGVQQPHEYDRMFTKPATRLNLTSEEVQAHLKEHTILHIGGLHRSGTTLLWQGLAEHPDVASLKFEPGADRRGKEWIERVYNEGIFLQTVYPRFGLDHQKHLIKKWVGQFARRIPFLESVVPWVRFREGVGRFALHPDHHLDEGSRLVNLHNQRLLFCQWGLLWNLERPVLLEKSPSNSVISPFLHRLWGLGLEMSPARFIFMRRHPIATAMATQKAGGINVNDLTIADMVENWLAAEERLKRDLDQYFDLEGPDVAAKTYRFLTLEELASDPRAVLTGVMEWLGIPVNEALLGPFVAKIGKDPNAKYFRKYCIRLVSNVVKREEYMDMVSRFGARVLAVSDYDLSKVVETCHGLLLDKPVGSDAEDAEDSKPSPVHEEAL